MIKHLTAPFFFFFNTIQTKNSSDFSSCSLLLFADEDVSYKTVDCFENEDFQQVKAVFDDDEVSRNSTMKTEALKNRSAQAYQDIIRSVPM